MKKLTIYGMALLSAAMLACTGGKTGSSDGSDADSTSVATDSLTASDGIDAGVSRLMGLRATMPPAPLYVRASPEEGEVVEVVYWTTAAGEDESAELQESWQIQELVRKNVNHYTKMLNGQGQLCDVTFDKEAEGSDEDVAMLRSPQHAMKGLKFKFNNPKDFAALKDDGYCLSTFWLLPDGYLANRTMLKVRHAPGEPVAYGVMLPDDLVKKMEEKYGMKAEHAGFTADVGNDYKVGYIQFKPKGEKCLAVELLVKGDEVWSYSEEAQFIEDENVFTWHVDDDGTYYPNSYDAAFEGPEGLELLFIHYAPESVGFGWMTLEGDKLVPHEVGGYYSYPE